MMDVPVLERLTGGSSKIHALTVGDLESVQRTLTTTDSGQHFDVISASTAREVRKYLRGLHPEVVLIDATLPGGAGLELCRHVRQQSPEAVIVLLSAAVRESYIGRGFEAGADDYLTRPFGKRELVCRIAAKLRRNSRGNRFEGIQTWSLRMDTVNLKAYLGGRPVALRLKEFELLAALAFSDGRLKLRKELITEVWGGGGRGPPYPGRAPLTGQNRSLPALRPRVHRVCTGSGLQIPPRCSPRHRGRGSGMVGKSSKLTSCGTDSTRRDTVEPGRVSTMRVVYARRG